MLLTFWWWQRTDIQEKQWIDLTGTKTTRWHQKQLEEIKNPMDETCKKHMMTHKKKKNPSCISEYCENYNDVQKKKKWSVQQCDTMETCCPLVMHIYVAGGIIPKHTPPWASNTGSLKSLDLATGPDLRLRLAGNKDTKKTMDVIMTSVLRELQLTCQS